jgi:hypothetical protein
VGLDGSRVSIIDDVVRLLVLDSTSHWKNTFTYQ